jgi:16S rRNA (cytidine1402-2'-O)-methyltransferase
MSNLYVVATPLGNLEDISKRALRILSEVDLILAEDTRNTKNLLNHFQISAPVISYHQHSKLNRVRDILAHLKKGHNIALVSDAGTPGISDPGGQLVETVIKELGKDIRIQPIPGPSAITTIASVCGFPMDRFVFLGFPPIKNKRQKYFTELLSYPYPVIFYESPYRILKTLNELLAISKSRNLEISSQPLVISKSRNLEISSQPLVISKSRNLEISVVVGRELTKKFETIYRGAIDEVIEQIKKDASGEKPRGEFVIAIHQQ